MKSTRSIRSNSIRSIMTLPVLASLLCIATTCIAQESGTESAQPETQVQPKKKLPTRVSKTRTPADGYTHVEMFKAMEEGTIKVELIAKDATQANIFVTNPGTEPLAVEMPEVFVGVPILGQIGAGGGGLGGGGGGLGGGGGFGGGGRGGGGFGGGGGQGVGGGFGGGQGGGGFGGGGGGFGGGGRGGGGGGFGGGVFNVAPGKRARVKVTTVCLEFHKPDPRPSMKYEIKPVDGYVRDKSVLEMLRMVANDEVTQPIAQAAAWHRLDGLSWQFLANHNRTELSNGYFERFFTPNQVSWARELVPFADQRVADRDAAETKKADSNEESRRWNGGR